MSDQGPATPGTAARCEGLIERRDASGTLHDFYGDDGCSSHMPEKCRACEYDRLKQEAPALRDRVRDYQRAVEARDEIIAAADAGIHRDLEVSKLSLEIERLKAENASLLESLRAAKERALRVFDAHEREMNGYLDRLRAAEQRAEAAEKRADMNGDLSSQWHDKWAAAEQRNTALEGALRAVLNDASIRPDGDTYIRLTDTDYRTAQAVLRAASPGRVCPPCLTGDHKNCRDEPDVGMECHCIHFRAALHDEERSAPPMEEK